MAIEPWCADCKATTGGCPQHANAHPPGFSFVGNQIPHRCPVCFGAGVVSRPPGVPADQESFMSSSVGPWQCQVCKGEGVLWR